MEAKQSTRWNQSMPQSNASTIVATAVPKANGPVFHVRAFCVWPGVSVPASAGSPTQHLQVQVPQARPSPFPPLTRRNDLQDTWRLRLPSALGISTMGPAATQVMTSNRSTSETKQGGANNFLTIPGTSTTVCILDYRASETDELSQITDNMAADEKEGEKTKSKARREERGKSKAG